MRQITWRLRWFIEFLLNGDQEWGYFRLLITLVIVTTVTLIGAGIDLTSPVTRLLFWEVTPVTDSGEPSLIFLVAVIIRILRHAIVPVSVALVWLAIGASYIQDVFELAQFRTAWNYLIASLFAIGYPRLVIRNGAPELADGKQNTLAQIGGPGFLDIKLGNAVLLERGIGPTQVLGSGLFFIRRFESIRDIIDLREIHRARAATTVWTKDGIQLTVRNIEATFRIDTGKEQRRTEERPYPYSTQAVRTAVYDRIVRGRHLQTNEADLGAWADGILGAIVGRVTDWIARQRLDSLTAPELEDPRAAIHAQFATPDVRRQFREMGAEIIWVNIGHIDTPDQVDQQRSDTWKSFWEREEKIVKAHGTALWAAYKDIGRSEGQAETLKALAAALDGVEASDGNARLAELMLLRVGQVIESMSAPPWDSERRQYPEKDNDSPSTPPRNDPPLGRGQ